MALKKISETGPKNGTPVSSPGKGRKPKKAEVPASAKRTEESQEVTLATRLHDFVDSMPEGIPEKSVLAAVHGRMVNRIERETRKKERESSRKLRETDRLTKLQQKLDKIRVQLAKLQTGK